MGPGVANTADEDEAALVAAIRGGNEAAFARIVDAWSPAMLRLVRTHVSTDASAEEVVQEAWIGALRGLDRFEGRSSLRTWVVRIAINLAKSRGERERRVVPLSSTAEGPTVDPARFRPVGAQYAGGWWTFPASWPPLPEGQLLSSELRDVLDGALARLPESQRAVMTLRDVGGYDAPEVCEALGITAGNQRVLLHRARASVRSVLESYLVGTPPTAPRSGA